MPINKMTFEDFPILNRCAQVKMKNKDEVLQKINNIIRGGAEKLQVVTDFDMTLTKQHMDGKPHLSSFGIFAKCKQLPPNYEEMDISIYKKYRKIEVDPHIVLEEKIQAMEEWMRIGEELITGLKIDPIEIKNVAKEHGGELREGTKILMEKLNRVQVPVLVFSAGQGDIVKAILEHNDVLFDNVQIISNFFKYSDGKLSGFKGKIIHVFNKNETTLDEEHLKRLEDRKNIILMGDSTGDSSMTDGVKESDNILKIGFLYNESQKIVDDSLEAYLNVFDVVLIDDQTMDLPLKILEKIV